MEATYIYVIAAGGIFTILFLLTLRPHFVQFIEHLVLWQSKYLTYPQILRRHSLLGPWTLAGFVLHTAYIAANVSCLEFWRLTTTKVGFRAANLALINMMPLFLGTHLSFLSNLFGVSLKSWRMVHRSAGTMSFFLMLLHILIVVASRVSFSLRVPENLYGLIGGSALCLLMLLSIPFLRKPSYEIFLRTHQALASLVVYSIVRHLISQSNFNWRYVYIFAEVFAALLAFQCGLVMFRNKAWGRHFPRAFITHIDQTAMVRMTMSRPIEVKAGHLADGKQDTLELFIQPRRGLTRELFSHGTLDKSVSVPRLALFSGPHGISVPVGEYETVLMVATGFGIAAQLPYLRKLIHGYNTCKARTRRVHLVWQVQNLDIGLAAQSLLNSALVDDTLDDGYILCISIYLESSNGDKVPFGKRATMYPGTANLEEILQVESTGKHIIRVQETQERGRMLVIVSGTCKLRDHLRALVRAHLDDGVKMQELDFQPE
ncbi:hypothetical protein V501_01286 [Pseudogymnoascus sp. VKM F-4519 (FW-2642)]|nr:hypothetical protein V501_01286 [Pseudogymnoascus sp. VKM F-4519 (FW-2642)]